MSQTTTKGKSRSALDEFGDQVSAGEVVPAAMQPHTLAILSRSEIDAQMATAGTRPRGLAQFRDTVKAIALMSEESAADCFYALPARREDGDPIEGPSIRYAEILVYAWHNCRVGARIIEEAMDHVTAQGVFNDVETNGVSTSEVRRRITDRRGRRYSPDMVNMTANAACSIARRNAILQGIPKPLWWDLYQETRLMAAGSEAELGPRRDKAIAAFKDLGIDEQRIFRMLGVDNAEQIDLDQLVRLRGIYTAVKEGTVSIREIKAPDQEEEPQKPVKSALDDFVADRAGAVVEDAPAESGPSLGVSPGGGSQTVHDVDDATAASSPPTFTKRQAIDKLLMVAGDEQTTREEQLEILDQRRPDYVELLGEEFTNALLSTVAKVIRGELKPAAAKKYLESLG